MIPLPPQPPGPAVQAPPADTETLACQLPEELAQRWRQGEPCRVEEILALHPQVASVPEVVVPLIYEEICLRQEAGHHPSLEEYQKRFPLWPRHLAILFECQHLLGPVTRSLDFHEVGQVLGDFHLLAELGRGRQGRVFLATQMDLADRPVVLKVVPLSGGLFSSGGCEHIHLARLQHTHIVPLLLVQKDPIRNRLVLCMPYLGGTSLARLLEQMSRNDPSRPWGQQLLETLDQLQPFSSLERRTRKGPARQFLAGATVIQAACWIGACLADALHHAHEQGLVHLDVKLSNVLLTADGLPMLLDFHLAREPLPAGSPAPDWLGGTPGCMAPEQEEALKAVQRGRPLTSAVDARADIYGLGMLLHHFLAAALAPGKETPPEVLVRSLGKQDLGTGLADILGKCLAAQPRHRYPTAAELAADLRRHMNNQSLRGVSNRRWSESWRKWRRRRPNDLAILVLLAGVLTVSLSAASLLIQSAHHRHETVETLMKEGQEQLQRRHFSQALTTLQHARDLAPSLMGSQELKHRLAQQIRLAEQGQAAGELHGLADQFRFLAADDWLAPQRVAALDSQLRTLWDRRQQIVDRLNPDLDSQAWKSIQVDLLDLAILGADLRVRLARGPAMRSAHQEARTILAQAEALLGTGAVLCQEQRRHARALGLPDAPPTGADPVPRTSWEHCTLGRSQLRTDHLDAAARHLIQARDLDPGGLWPNYYLGLCAFRLGRHQEAVMAFSACAALMPEAAGVLFNRALALAALNCPEQARLDYDRALRLDPGLAPAVLNRGLLHYQAGRLTEAANDLQRALELGYDPATAHFNIALIHLARGDAGAARASIRRALKVNPGHAPAQRLLETLP